MTGATDMLLKSTTSLDDQVYVVGAAVVNFKWICGVEPEFHDCGVNYIVDHGRIIVPDTPYSLSLDIYLYRQYYMHDVPFSDVINELLDMMVNWGDMS